jgi:hypothetical protein
MKAIELKIRLDRLKEAHAELYTEFSKIKHAFDKAQAKYDLANKELITQIIEIENELNNF